jgi:hypothetical protein
MNNISLKTLVVAVVVAAAGTSALIFAAFSPAARLSADFSAGKSSLGPPETITGITFPVRDGHVTIGEPLAHVRVPFTAPAVGKRLTWKTTLGPTDADSVQVGIRRSEFWLDYERVALDPAFREEQVVTFALDHAYQNPDGSLDIMYFTRRTAGEPQLAITRLSATIVPAVPSSEDILARLRSVAKETFRRPKPPT